jgi:calcium-dependent protein kinase
MGACTSKSKKGGNKGGTPNTGTGMVSNANQQPIAMGQVKKPGASSKKAGTEDELMLNPSNFISHKAGSIKTDYIMGKMINKGSFGEVFMATHRPTKEIRAVKKIEKPTSARNRNQVQEFLEEFDLLRQLNHPNIIRVYEIYEDRCFYYIVTEYCKGGELFEIIVANNAILTEKNCASIIE